MVARPEKRTRITNQSIVERYLPPDIAARLADIQPQEGIDSQHLLRLEHILRRIVSYIPAYAIQHHLITNSHQRMPIMRPYGTMLSADLSGFTAFSNSLNVLGAEGAEIVAATIGSLFEALIGTQERWGGTLLKLSGDALTVLFSQEDHAQAAAAAALEMQRQMHAFAGVETPVGRFQLQLRVGLASGPVVLAELGTADRVEVLAAGKTAHTAVETQHQAAPGHVMADASTFRLMGTRNKHLNPGRCYPVEPHHIHIRMPAPHPALQWQQRSDSFWQAQALIQRIEHLRPFLIRPHFDLLCSNDLALANSGELRPVTVLFAHLTDATELLHQSDDQQALKQLRTRTARMWEIVEQHGGIVNKLDIHSNGHTLIALFGAPLAHGDDADRALLCAQALLAANPLPIQPLCVDRIGIASGRVYAGSAGSKARREYTVMGAAVNLAARLMDLAQTNEVLIDEATAAAARVRMRLEPRPATLIKGFETPQAFFQASTQPPQPLRLRLLTQSRGPLLGRDSEVVRAQACVAGALAGDGHTLVIEGEAGIGKTHLLATLANELPTSTAIVAIAQTQPQTRGQPYALILALLRQLCQLDDDPVLQIAQLREAVNTRTGAQARFLPLLFALFGIDQESALTRSLTPDDRRLRLIDLCVALIRGYAHELPTVLIVEDLHWTDSASIDIVHQLTLQCTDVPLLVLATTRPDPRLDVLAQAGATVLALAGLQPKDSLALLDSMLESTTLPPALRATVIERTQGNPLFLAETARTLRDQPTGALRAPLPTTVQSAFQARLDRLSGLERDTLRVAAVVGARFRNSTLAEVSGIGGELTELIGRLVQADLIRPDPSEYPDTFAFTHSLIQETAYESLLFTQRRQLHHQVASSLRATDTSDATVALLAFHYRHAEDWPETLAFSWQAGQTAEKLYAHDVALGHYHVAAEAAGQMDGSEPSLGTILERCGEVYALSGSYTEALGAYQQAFKLFAEPAEKACVLLHWAEVYEQQGAYDQALERLELAAQLLGDQPGSDLALRVMVRRGWVLARQGEDEQARDVIDPILEELEQRSLLSDLLLVYRMLFLIAHNQARWSEARMYLRFALRYAQQLGDIREIARLQNNLGAIAGQEGQLHEAAAALQLAEGSFAEIGDPYNLASVHLNLGAIHFKMGDYEHAQNHYDQSLAIATRIADLQTKSIVHSNLGELYRQIGQPERSLQHLEAAEGLCVESGDSYGCAEALLQRAQTLLSMQAVDGALLAFETAQPHLAEAGDPQLEAVALRVHSQILLARGELDAALESAIQSTRLLTELGNKLDIGHSLMAQATIFIAWPDPYAAQTLVAEAVLLFQRSGAAADEQRAITLLSHLADNLHPKEHIL